jgi:hypothetical protein
MHEHEKYVGAQMAQGMIGGGELLRDRLQPSQLGGNVAQQPVDASLDMLEKALAVAHEELSMLCGRLQLVTTPAPPIEQTGRPHPPVSCALDGRIVDACMRVGDLAENIRSLRSSLCI